MIESSKEWRLGYKEYCFERGNGPVINKPHTIIELNHLNYK